MKWSNKKNEVIQELDSRKITCNDFRNKYLKFMRSVTTCQNMLNRGNSWDVMSSSVTFDRAKDQIFDLKENHFKDWQKLTGAVNDNPYFSFPNLGDFLA